MHITQIVVFILVCDVKKLENMGMRILTLKFLKQLMPKIDKKERNIE